MYDKTHYNIVISLQLIKINEKKKEKMLASWKKSHDQPRQHIKKQRHHFANKDLYRQRYRFSSSHIRMWALDHNEGWALKNWCFRAVEKTLESPLDSKEIKPVNPKGNQPWIFIGKIDPEAPILWPPDATHWKRPWCWERWRARGEGSDRRWDGCMASMTQWTWDRANSGR